MTKPSPKEVKAMTDIAGVPATAEVAERIANSLTNPAHKRVLAFADGKLVGFISGTRGETARDHSQSGGILLLLIHAGKRVNETGTSIRSAMRFNGNDSAPGSHHGDPARRRRFN